MSVEADFDHLLERLHEISDLSHAAALLEWDLQVTMPPRGAAARFEQLATLRGLEHARLVDARLGEAIERCEGWAAAQPPDAFAAAAVRVARRDHERARRIPVALAAETSRAASEGLVVWQEARAHDDFARFRPALERMLELQRRTIECFAPFDDPYDALLAAYEPGVKTAAVAEVFATLLPELRRILAAAPTEPEEPFAAGPYDAGAQHAVSLEAARALGVEDGCFRLDPTAHPFCLALDPDDVRLTTRYGTTLADHALFSVLHEVGHGLYEHGVDRRFGRTPVAGGASAAFHESQSRLWENVVGRSLPFWRWFYPRLQAAHPALLARVPVERFHRAITRPRPSLVRVSADEVTYGLHVILRFELERALLDGSLPVADLPEAWGARLEELVGLRPPSDALGCLQDVHWAEGLFGYFPSYQLGNVLSVQIWSRLERDVPDAEARIGEGRFEAVHEWLRTRVYAHGRSLTPPELLDRLGCGPLDSEPYLAHLRRRSAP